MKKFAILMLACLLFAGCAEKQKDDPTPTNDGLITGIMQNAETGMPEMGVQLNARPGTAQTGNPTATGTTDTFGSFRIELPRGEYTIEAVKEGMISSYFEATATYPAEAQPVYPNISRTLAAGEIRIVLSWGSTPSDLDAHLTCPRSGMRGHVYWLDKTEFDAVLDVDDTSSYGPETITISNMQSGTYKYYVHDYSNDYKTHSTALGNSGAKVRVYKGSTLINTLSVPNTDGTLWKVLEISNGNVNIINAMDYASGSTSPVIQSVSETPQKRPITLD